ncbi:aldo/keto reductase [Leucothrix pacifica]|uniref:Aldo/keto reductase n=1 Tax=Leucothrix pacifica TaxID=1247513 RepID=A0A317CMA6_9GAMM|nr:aldo/keto reductase [Leucothrix pacifica]PWQ99664.1 aldo/keto reductase [Leucothrix pacifica]
MQYKTLGNALEVPLLCLGSMTWGSQNTEAEGHEQISMSMANGVNFIDTAEMYPVAPIRSETVGDSEKTIGSWIAKNGQRDRMLIATKVSGEGLKFVRNGARITPDTIDEALENSLRNLNTDYVDLYQLHWPNRGSYHFRQYWNYKAPKHQAQDTDEHFAAISSHLDTLVKAGKIRHWGLSNESAWGMGKWLSHSEGKTRPISIQNEYSLLCRLFDTDLGELCVNEDVGLLSYSPLATGLLTGKYQNGAVPEKSRMSIERNLSGRATEKVWPAVDAYLALAKENGLDPVQMSLAWAMQRPFMGSVIFGATNLQQLEVALGAQDLVLSDEVMAEIDRVNMAHPMPF